MIDSLKGETHSATTIPMFFFFIIFFLFFISLNDQTNNSHNYKILGISFGFVLKPACLKVQW